jgi:excisionase family DNA binding protein
VLKTLADQFDAISHALTAEDLAEKLQVTPTMIRKLAREGRLPSFRVGTAVRFDPKLVAAWLRRN